jgi:hypothetical protein
VARCLHGLDSSLAEITQPSEGLRYHYGGPFSQIATRSVIASKYLGHQPQLIFQTGNQYNTTSHSFYRFTNVLSSMKFSHIVLGSCLAGFSQASTQTAYLFPFDITTQDSSKTLLSLSPPNARLLLAQRFSSSNDLSLGDVDEDVILALNRFGGAQRSLFGEDQDVQRLSKLLIVVEGSESHTYGEFVIYQAVFSWSPH